MFDGSSNIHLSGELLKMHYPKVSFMRGVEHTVSLFFNDASKMPVVDQMIIVQLYWLNWPSAVYIRDSQLALFALKTDLFVLTLS